jgi:hypothetical protein
MAAPAPLKRPPTADYLKSAKKPIEKTHVIYHDDETVEAFEAAQIKFNTAEIIYTDEPEKLAAAKAALEAARQAVVENSTELKLRGIGRKVYSDHPPTDEQKAKVEKDTNGQGTADWNPDTFIPALLSLTVYEPKFTAEEWAGIIEDWTDGELTDLYQKALVCNMGRRTDVLGKD